MLSLATYDFDENVASTLSLYEFIFGGCHVDIEVGAEVSVLTIAEKKSSFILVAILASSNGLLQDPL